MDSKREFFKALIFITFLAAVNGACQIKTNRCQFPFEREGQNHTKCIAKNDDHIEYEDGSEVSGDKYYCKQTLHGIDAFLPCNDSCLDDEKKPMSFDDDSGEGLSVFCKNAVKKCIFPFTHEGQTYDKCTSDGLEGTSEKWCAIEVDDKGEMVPGGFGICDDCEDEVVVEDHKKPAEEVVTSAPEAQASSRSILISIDETSNKNGIKAAIEFSQVCPTHALKVKGTVSGLEPDTKHGFHVHQNPELGNDCLDAGPHFNPLNQNHGGLDSIMRHVGDFGNIEANSEGVADFEFEVNGTSIFTGEISILNRAIVIHALPDDLGQGDTPDSNLTGSSGARLACALIRDPDASDNFLMIIIIAVVAILIFLIVLAIVIYCCLKKRKSKVREKVPFDDPDFGDYANGDARKKSPLFDELSIPFIDASQPPTPKTGRSTDRLSSFFNRTPSIGRSRASLSNEEK